MRTVVPFVLSVFFCPMALAAPITLTPGLWDMTVEAKIFGQTQNFAEPECLKPEHAALEPSDLAALIKENLGCDVANLKQEPGTLSLTLSCPETPFHNSEFTGTHTPTSLTLEAIAPVGSLSIRGIYSGQACR